jgi:hypothetical protein
MANMETTKMCGGLGSRHRSIRGRQRTVEKISRHIHRPISIPEPHKYYNVRHNYAEIRCCNSATVWINTCLS